MCGGDLAPLHPASSRSIPGNGENPKDVLEQEWSMKRVVALTKTLAEELSILALFCALSRSSLT